MRLKLRQRALATKSSYWLIVLHCVLPLLIGCLVYLFLRTGTVLNYVFETPDLSEYWVYDNQIASIIKFNLPDFLWAYSLSAALLFWQQKRGKADQWFVFTVVVLIATTEVGQIFFQPQFTFDLLDVVAALSGSTLSYYLISWQNANKKI